jgi:hypothetical protein
MRRSLVAVLAAAGIAGIALGQEPGLSPRSPGGARDCQV